MLGRPAAIVRQCLLAHSLLTIDSVITRACTQGIQVTTPEERRAGQIAQVMRQGDATEISFVWIPADTSNPMQERTVPVPAGYRGDYLVEYLQKEFAAGSEKVDISLLQQQAQQTLAASPDTPATVSDATLRQVAQTASVETFVLVHATPSNQFTSIHIYLDEVGMLKRLPLNSRAAQFAEHSGFNPPPQFYGDISLGRVQKKPAVRNLSFNLGVDTAMDAPWLRAATTENLEYQTALNETTGRTNVRQAAVAGSDGQAVTEEAAGFKWTQTEQELEVVVSLTETVKSKDVVVKFRPQNLSVTVQKVEQVQIRLFEHVDVDGCTWTIDRSGQESNLVITMEKAEGALWPRIID